MRRARCFVVDREHVYGAAVLWTARRLVGSPATELQRQRWGVAVAYGGFNRGDARRHWDTNLANVICRISLFIDFKWSTFKTFSVDFHNKKTTFIHHFRNNRMLFDFEKGMPWHSGIPLNRPWGVALFYQSAISRNSSSYDLTRTGLATVAEGPRDAPCQLKNLS